MRDANAATEPGYGKLSNRTFLLIFACGAPAWLFFVYRDQDFRGFIAGLSVCAVLGVAAILGHYRHLLSFWITLAAITFAHVLFVFAIDWPQQFHGAGIVFAPLVIGDMYVSAKLVLFMVKRSGA
jgi:hypothetical protein